MLAHCNGLLGYLNTAVVRVIGITFAFRGPSPLLLRHDIIWNELCRDFCDITKLTQLTHTEVTNNNDDGAHCPTLTASTKLTEGWQSCQSGQSVHTHMAFRRGLTRQHQWKCLWVFEIEIFSGFLISMIFFNICQWEISIDCVKRGHRLCDSVSEEPLWR